MKLEQLGNSNDTSMALHQHLLYSGSKGEVSFERERAIGKL